MWKDTLRQQHFHNKFVLLVVILITRQEIAKREAEVVHEVDEFRVSRSQKTNNATHLRQPRTL